MCSAVKFYTFFRVFVQVVLLASVLGGKSEDAEIKNEDLPAGQVSTPLTSHNESWPYVIADAIVISYASVDDRDVALQQITTVWEEALAPQITGIQLILVDDHAINVTLADHQIQNLVTYVILGQATTKVDPFGAKTVFRELLAITRIPVTPVVIPDVSVGSNIRTTAFALLDSVWMNYTDITRRDYLLFRIKTLWQDLMSDNATSIRMTLYNDTISIFGSPGSHQITYIITGNSAERIEEVQAKKLFRKILGYMNLQDVSAEEVDELGVPVKTPVKTTTASIFQIETVFSIVESVLLPYKTEVQRDELLQQIRALWVMVLGSTASGVNLRFLASQPLPDSESSKPSEVYNVTYEVMGFSSAPVDVQKLQKKFYHEVAALFSPPPTLTTPETVTKSPLSPSTLVSNNTSLLSGSENSLEAAEKLIKQVQARINITDVNTFVFDDNIELHTFSNLSGYLNLAMEFVKHTWMEVIGPEALAVEVAAYKNSTLPSNTSDSAYNIDYIVLVMSEKPYMDVEAAKTLFRTFLARPRNSSIPLNVTSGQSQVAVKLKMTNTVIVDSISAEFADAFNDTVFTDILKSIWKEVVGNQASDVQVAIYRNVNRPALDSSSGNGSFYNLSYVAVIRSSVPDLDVDTMKDQVRELLSKTHDKGFVVVESRPAVAANEIELVQTHETTPGPEPMLGLTIPDSLEFKYTNDSSWKDDFDEITRLWKETLGSEVNGIRIRIDNETVETDPDGTKYYLIFYTVFIVTKSTTYDQQAVRNGFREKLSGTKLKSVIMKTAFHGAENSRLDLFNSGVTQSSQLHEPTTIASKTTMMAGNFELVIAGIGTAPWMDDHSWRTYIADFINSTEQSQRDTYGSSLMEVRVDVEEPTEIVVDGQRYLTFSVMVYSLLRGTDWDQHEIKESFQRRISSKLTNYVLKDYQAAAQTLPTPKLVSTNNSEIWLNQPEPVQSYIFQDNIQLQNTSENVVNENIWMKLTTFWINFLGSSAVNLQLQPLSESENNITGTRTLSYLVLVLSKNQSFEVNSTVNAFHQFLSSSNQTEIIPSVSVANQRNAFTSSDVFVIPAGISLSYSSQDELANLLKVIQNLWRKVLESNSSHVEVMLYNDKIDNSLKSLLQSEKVIHQISYIIIVQTNGSKLDAALAKSQFEKVLPSVGFTISPIIRTFPELPLGLIIPDHIWLVYKNIDERDQLLEQLRQTWESVLESSNASNIHLDFDHEETDDSISGRDDSHKVFYTVSAETRNRNLDVEESKRKFRHQLPSTGMVFGFDIDEVPQRLDNLSPVVNSLDNEDASEALKADARSDTDSKTNVSGNSVLLQFSDQQERDSELSQIKAIWADVIGQKNVDLELVSDKIQSTDNNLKAGSVHFLIYNILVTRNDSVNVSNWKAIFNASLANTKLPFILQTSQLISANTSRLLEFFPDNSVKTAGKGLVQILTNATWSDGSERFNVEKGHTVLRGNIPVNFVGNTDRNQSITQLQNIWNEMSDFDHNTVQLSIFLPKDSDSGLLNLTYVIWSSTITNLADIGKKFEAAISSKNFAFLIEDPNGRSDDLSVSNVPANKTQKPSDELITIQSANSDSADGIRSFIINRPIVNNISVQPILASATSK